MFFKVSFLARQATTLFDLFIAIGQHLNSVVAHNQKALEKNLPKRDIAKRLDIIQMNFWRERLQFGKNLSGVLYQE